jgi:hypothetical protein
MKFYCGDTRTKKYIDLLSSYGVGEVNLPNTLPPRRHPWFLDNGAWVAHKKGKRLDEGKFWMALKKLESISLQPDFVVVPDIVGGGAESLEYSLSWVDRIQGVNRYLAVQNWMTTTGVGSNISRFEGIFVGGTSEWKEQTAHWWVKFAHKHSVPCHIGRAGTEKKIKWAYEIRADSIDSSFPLWTVDRMKRFCELAVQYAN